MRSLRSTLTWWLVGSLLAIYLFGSLVIWLVAWRDVRRDLNIAVTAEAEGVAAALAIARPQEVEELRGVVADPIPIWVRLLAGNEVVATAPGFPQRPSRLSVAAPGSRLERWRGADGEGYVSVFEAVGAHPGWRVEATARTAVVAAQQGRLAWALLLAGLVLSPIVALVSRHLARWGLEPLARLVGEVRSFDDSRLTDRLAIQADAPEELHSLTQEFNLLLARIEATVKASHRFIADASHELRNPLSVLRTGLEVTLRRPRDTEEYRLQLVAMLGEIERLQATLESLLLLARDAPGEVPRIDRRPVSLAALVAATLASLEVAADERGVALRNEVASGLQLVGEESLLRLLLFNLVDNAIRFSPAGGEVRIEAQHEESAIVLRVRDQGPGVDPALRPRLFERFVSGRGEEGAGHPDRGRSERVGGLGLAFSRWVAQRHGGGLELEESGDGGCCFRVLLPGSPVELTA